MVVGAALGIAVAGLVGHLAGAAGWADRPWLVAPLGASAVLVFAVPASPLAQPWAVVGGNTLSALVGVACVAWLGRPELAAPLAVALAIAVMFAARCLHPPGGASALLVALGGIGQPAFALHPVLLNSLGLVLAGMVYNHLTGRAYPHRQIAARAAAARDLEAAAIDADLDAVLAHYNQVLDISRDDLKSLLGDTQLRAFQRTLSSMRCQDIMSRQPVTVGLATPLAQAWDLLQAHRIKALPVVDTRGGVVGIVTQADFLRDHGPAFERVTAGRAGPADAGRPAATDPVSRIMTRRVRVASASRHLSELVPLFASTGHHHLPIVDDESRLVGILTQSDLVAALLHSGPPDA